MTPKQSSKNAKITARDLAARDKRPEVKAIYDRALRDAYREQQELLKKAAKISK